MPFIVTPLVNNHAGIYIHTPYNYVVLTWTYDAYIDTVQMLHLLQYKSFYHENVGFSCDIF